MVSFVLCAPTMMNTASLALLFSILAPACASNENDSPADFDCTQEQLGMSGAFEVNTPSVATLKVSNVVIGVGGFGAGSPPTTSYAFTLRDPFSGELESVGAHDVTTANLKYVLAPASADCLTPGACSGFVAVAGTYEVHSTQPRYHASFVLEELHAYDGSSNDLGPTIAGEIHGCIDASGN